MVLTPGFPSGEQDSTCLPAQQEFVLSLRRKAPGMKIIIIAFQYPFREETYNWYGVEVIAFNGRNRSRLHRILLWRRVRKKMNALCHQYSILGVISFWYGECCLLGSRFARKHSLLHYCWILGQDARAGNPYVSWTGAPAGELVAMSDFLSDEFHSNYAIRPGNVITNGIGVETKAEPVHRDIDVLGTGSLIPLKQYHLFVESIREAKNYYPKIKSVICGKGPEKKRLQEMIAEAGLEENIHLTDEVDHDEVINLMHRSRLLLHPSLYEGFSTVCLEALASGAHVLSFCKPMRHSITHWHIVNSFEQMKDELVSILQNPLIEHKPIVPFTMDDVADKWMKLLVPQLVIKKEELV